MSYTIRSRYSRASTPIFIGGDRMLQRPGEGRTKAPIINPGTGGGMPEPPAGQPGDSNTPTGGSTAAIKPGFIYTLTAQQVQQMANDPVLSPLIPQLIAGEQAGVVQLAPDQTAAAPAPAPAPAPATDVPPTDLNAAPLPDQTLPPGYQTGTAPVGYTGTTATGADYTVTPAPQNPADTSALGDQTLPPGYQTPPPDTTVAPASADVAYDPGVYDPALDPSLTAPPLDAIDYTNSNSTAV